MEEGQEVKKNLWNLLKGKISFDEYITGRIRWFMSWENVKTFILYFFMLSLGLVLYQTASKNYENHQECLLGHQLMTKQVICYDNSIGVGMNILNSNLTISNNSSSKDSNQNQIRP